MNALYPKTKALMLQGGINLLTADVRAALISDEVSYNDTHDTLANISAGILARSASLTGKDVDASTAAFDSDNPTFPEVDYDDEDVVAVVLYIHGSTDETSRLLAWFDTGLDGVPLTPDGRDIRIVVDDGGWFEL